MAKRINDSLPNEVKHLRLGSAFRSFTNTFSNCIETTSDKRFFIVDDGYTRISNLQEDEHRACIANNPNSHQVIVLAIDHKLIAQRVGGMADGAAFDMNNFYLLEFKDQAQGKTIQSIEETFDKAMLQLRQALNLFIDRTREVGVDLMKEVNVEAHIIVNDMHPRISSIEQSRMLAFPMDNNGVPLSFDRQINF